MVARQYDTAMPFFRDQFMTSFCDDTTIEVVKGYGYHRVNSEIAKLLRETTTLLNTFSLNR